MKKKECDKKKVEYYREQVQYFIFYLMVATFLIVSFTIAVFIPQVINNPSKDRLFIFGVLICMFVILCLIHIDKYFGTQTAIITKAITKAQKRKRK